LKKFFFLKTIKQIRISIKKTQKEVATKLNCNQSSISLIEKGANFGKYYHKYLKYLVENGVDINKLFK